MNNLQKSPTTQRTMTRKNFAETEFEPLSLDEILAIYKRWYKLSLITFVGILIPAVAVIFLILPLHQASGTIWINRLMPQSEYAVHQGAMTGNTTFRNLNRNEEIATYAEMIKARPIAEATIDRLAITMEKLNHIHDARRYVQAVMNGVIDGARFIYNETKFFLRLGTPMSPEMEAELNRVRLIDEVIERIEVTPITESNIVQVSFKSSDPVLARDAVNVLLDEFLTFSSSIREKRAQSFFTSLTSEQRDSLQAAEAELLDMQKTFASYSVDQQRQVLVTAYAEAKNRQRDIEVEILKLEAEVEAYRQRLQEEPAGKADGKTFESGSRGVLQKANPSLYQELKLRLVNAEVELISAKTEAQASEEMLKKYLDELTILGNADLMIKAQQRKIDQLEEAYQINLRNLDSARAVQAMHLASLSAVRIVSYASYPLKPIRPRRLYYLLIAFGGAVLIGLAMPFMAYINDKNVANAGDVKKYLGLDFVITFPDLKKI